MPAASVLLAPASAPPAWSPSTAADYLALMKPRVMMLSVFTGAAGLVRAPWSLHPLWALVGLLCMALGAGASGALNMWYERHADALMRRTAQRPLPTGRILPQDALATGIIAAGAAVMIMGLVNGPVPAFLLAFTILWYSVLYTMILKPRTPQNIVWGGLAGALPPVIGWSCASGLPGLLHPEPWLMCALIMAWTPPHFWALAVVCQEDYDRTGWPMMPRTAGLRHTLVQMRAWALGALLAVVLLAAHGWYAQTLHHFSALMLACNGLWFVWCVWRVRAGNTAPFRLLFQRSILFLFLVFALLLGDACLP